MRADLAVHPPLEQPDRAINGVTGQLPRLKIEALPETLDHRVGDSDLGNPIGLCVLDVDDDPGFVVDEAS